MKKPGFYKWLVIALFGAMFFGATVARIETKGIMIVDLSGAFMLGLSGIVGCVNAYRAAKKGTPE